MKREECPYDVEIISTIYLRKRFVNAIFNLEKKTILNQFFLRYKNLRWNIDKIYRERESVREKKSVCDGGDIENICESIASTLTHNGAKMILYIQTV